jgi:hypothetical protein
MSSRQRDQPLTPAKMGLSSHILAYGLPYTGITCLLDTKKRAMQSQCFQGFLASGFGRVFCIGRKMTDLALAMDTQQSRPLTVAERIIAKQQRIAGKVEELRAEYVASSAVLEVIAGFLDEAKHGRSNWVRTRSANAANRLLRGIPRKQPKRPANAAEWYENDE